MGRSRSHRALSANALQAPGSGNRVAELEAQLKATQLELEKARAAHQEDSAGFGQALARLTQSERALSQTRAKLVEAEAKAEGTSAQLRELRELAESLSKDSAAGTEECAKLNEILRDAEARVTAAQGRAAAADARALELETRLAEAEAREREALIAAEEARDERAAALAEIESLRLDQGDSGEARRQLAAAEARLDTLTHERVRLLDLFASLEVLGREITHLTQQATPDSPELPKVEAWLGRDVEAEHVRATVRPEAFVPPPAQASRTWSTPEIVIDGVKIDS